MDKLDHATSIRKLNSRIAFVSGNFNIIHPGHIRFLLFAKEQAETLVVGLNDQKYSLNTYFSNQERMSALASLSFVDEVVLIEEDLEEFLYALQPQVIVKGKEFEQLSNIEQEIAAKFGGKVLFSSGEKQFSTKELLLQQAAESSKIGVQLQKFHQRYNISEATLRTHLKKFENLNVAIFGDIIIDEYQECLPIGMSQEDPTIAVSPLESFQYLGGAGIVSAHARRLGANVTFYSVVGNDGPGKFARSKLHEYDVKSIIIEDKTRPTTHKLRYRAKNKTLLRVNSFRKHAIEHPTIDSLVSSFQEQISSFDAVIFSDFSFGVLCPTLIQKIQKLCVKHSIPMVADSQTSSQKGDLNKFNHLMLTTPTELEARLAVQDDDNGLIQVTSDLANQLNTNNLIVTLGAEGVLIRHREDLNSSLETDNLPALSDVAIDTAGAGDAFFVATTLMLCTGASIWQASFIGSVASAVQVNTMGNVPINTEELVKKIQELIQ